MTPALWKKSEVENRPKNSKQGNLPRRQFQELDRTPNWFLFSSRKENGGEKWWVLRIFKDMQTQITKPYQLTAASRAISINAANNKYWSDCGEMCTLDSKGDVVSATTENTKKVLWKGKHGATSQWITPTAGPITWENENQKVTGWQSCTPTIFTITNTWKQWKCPSTEECTK